MITDRLRALLLSGVKIEPLFFKTGPLLRDGLFETERAREVEKCLIDPLSEIVTVIEDALRLHDRVEMDESVGVCLTDRVESLRLGDSLAKLEAKLAQT